MSTIWKVVLVLVIVGAVGFGWKYMSTPKNQYSNTPVNRQTTNTGSSVTVVPVNNTTNASLEANLTSIDTQMNAVNQSSAQVESSFNDKPVTQSE